MKKCLVYLLDVLIFVNGTYRLTNAFVRRIKNIKIYKIALSEYMLAEQYSLLEYDSNLKKTRTVLADTSLEHIMFKCAVMNVNQNFLLIDPAIPRKHMDLEITAHAEDGLFCGYFSFADQLKPFSAIRLLKELTLFPFAAFL